MCHPFISWFKFYHQYKVHKNYIYTMNQEVKNQLYMEPKYLSTFTPFFCSFLTISYYEQDFPFWLYLGVCSTIMAFNL